MAEEIPIFLSVGESHNDKQERYLNELEKLISKLGIKTVTLGRTEYDLRSPLKPVSEWMNKVNGALILAMERFHSYSGVYREGSEHQSIVSDQYFSTVWNQIEGSMAYLLNLPMLIMKESNIVDEGIYDAKIHDWMVIRINPENPEELYHDPINSYIKEWIRHVKIKYYSDLKNKRN